jgi:hypothetical protein
MAQSIGLSFLGDGRIVTLTPRTVRRAFFQLVKVNRLTSRELGVFDAAGFNVSGSKASLMDRLHRRGGKHAPPGDSWISAPEIDALEREMNQLLLRHNFRLAANEGPILQLNAGWLGNGVHLRKRTYTIRCGIIFDLEPLDRTKLLKGMMRDICIEGNDRSLQFLRYERIVNDRRLNRLMLRYADRFDLAQKKEEPLARFAPRRMFTIRRILPSEGFHLEGLSRLAQG